MIKIDTSQDFLLAADLVLLSHVLFVGFIIFGLVFILVGKFRSWSWIRNPWFRLLHLLAICVVVIQTWLGIVCPLTALEKVLRDKAGDIVYGGSFVSYWLGKILYYQFPDWVFAVSYTVFAAAVIYSWFLVPPRRFKISD
jgi:Protein of Unknown function (DUF2784)